MKRVLLLIAIIAAVPRGTFAQTASLMPDFAQSQLGTTSTLALGYVCTYASGTTTNKATYPTYADAIAGTNANTNPVRLNTAGRPVNGSSEIGIWLSTGAYTLILYPAGTGSSCNGTTVGAAIKTVNSVIGNVTVFVPSLTPCDVTFSATPAFDASLCSAFRMTLAGNVTGSTITNPTNGQIISFAIKENGTGGYTFSMPANADLCGLSVLTAAAAQTNFSLWYDASTSRWRNWGPCGNEAFSGNVSVGGTFGVTGLSTLAGGLAVTTGGTFGTNISVNGAILGSRAGDLTITFMGSSSLRNASTGSNNTAIGYGTLFSATTIPNATAVGYNALNKATTGAESSAFGSQACAALTTSVDSTCIGTQSGLTLTTGNTNTLIGAYAGQSMGAAVASSVFLGYTAGKYSTTSNEFYIDNQDRTDEAGQQAKALMYGRFNGTASSQQLFINAVVAVTYALVGQSIRGTAVAVAALPAAPVEGMMVPVNNATSNTWGDPIAGGGANHVLAFYNGSGWTVAGK